MIICTYWNNVNELISKWLMRKKTTKEFKKQMQVINPNIKIPYTMKDEEIVEILNLIKI